MNEPLESLEPGTARSRARRQRLSLRDELMLALLPTVTVLGVMALVQALSQQRLLFASLASSAFLIYLDPEHGMNRVRTLAVAQLLAAVLGLGFYLALGPGYLSAGTAMVGAVILMIAFDAVHPPAISTALSFALRAGDESNLVLFVLAVAITAALVGLQRAAVWLLTRGRRSRTRAG